MAFGIYGTDYPAYKLSGIKYGFVYAEVLRDEPEWEYIVHESILTGYRSITMTGAHWVVEMNLRIYKDNNLDDTKEAAERIQNLLWNDSAFTYYRHSSGQELKDAGGTAVEFKLIEFRPEVEDWSNYKDSIFIKIISLDYVKVVPTES